MSNILFLGEKFIKKLPKTFIEKFTKTFSEYEIKIREGLKNSINYFRRNFREGGTPPPFMENNYFFSKKIFNEREYLVNILIMQERHFHFLSVVADVGWSCSLPATTK